MQKIEILVGIPGSGKSTYCKQIMDKNPGLWKRINNDCLREMVDFGKWSKDDENIISDLRNHMIKDFLKRGYNILIDNLNINKRHLVTVCEIAKSLNIDVQIYEKTFYIELEEAIERDSKRDGKAKVGEEIIKKWFKELGGKQHKFYKPRMEIFQKCNGNNQMPVLQQDNSLPKAAIFDLDGTMCNISHRNPYDASNCNKDIPNQHVVDLCKLLSKNDYEIFFFSGREDKHRTMTEEWLNFYFGTNYSLFMRESNNFEDDRLLKERLFNTYIKNKYNCKLWVDDRLRVCKFIYESGLPLFRVGDPEANF